MHQPILRAKQYFPLMSDSLPGRNQPNMEEQNTTAPGEGCTGEVPASDTAPEAASQPPTALHYPLRRQDSASTTGSMALPVSQLPPGLYKIRIQGSCPYCKHWHRTTTARISLNPAIFTGVRCEKCSRKWFGIGGNDSHASFASQETLPDSDRPIRSALHTALLQNVRSLSAVGSPTLAVLEEDTTPSPLRTRPDNPFPSHSRSTSQRSAVHTPSSATKVTMAADEPTTQEMTHPEPEEHLVEPFRTTHTPTQDSNGPQKLGVRKRLAKRVSKKWPRMTKKYKDVKDVLKNTLKSPRFHFRKTDKVKATAVEPQSSQEPHQEPPPDQKLEYRVDDDTISEPEATHDKEIESGQPQNRPSDKGKGTAEAEQPSSATNERLRSSSNDRSSPSSSPEIEGQASREEAISYLRKKLTEERACTCGPNCGPECRCRHHGRERHTPRAEDDSSVRYFHPNDASDVHVPRLRQGDSRTSRNSYEFQHMGGHLGQQPESIYAPSLNISAETMSNRSNRFSIITTVSTASNFSTAITAVESERGLTAMSPPPGLPRPRPQSLPRPQPHYARFGPASPPMSPLRVSTFATARNSYASSSDDRDDGERTQDDLDDLGTTPTQHNYRQEALRSLQELERGRSPVQNHAQDNDGQQGDAIARQDHAPVVDGHTPMVNGHDYERRLSEPTSSTA
ncbi:hypothetical protein BU16DRAFT_542324 [Lophium mytilinum]|uniref:Uncharacterized protein n=1 Tax=Lophium mytilinum TaxID=390894 RepID=A0A6A6QNF1_9PEZI|nr:hypothetical protein BU16DRAFT_542324 [Lophium mytilinum]